MALSNAERQARHRERVKQKLAAASAEPLRNEDGDVVKLRKQVARLKEQLAEKEAQRAAQEASARWAWKEADKATNRAMFAEADRERLAEEVEELRNGGHEAGLERSEEMLLCEYYGVAETWFQYLGNDEEHPAYRHKVEAHNAFLKEEIGALDIIMMIQHEAFDRLNDYFTSSCTYNGLPEQGVQEPKWRSHAKTLSERVT